MEAPSVRQASPLGVSGPTSPTTHTSRVLAAYSFWSIIKSSLRKILVNMIFSRPMEFQERSSNLNNLAWWPSSRLVNHLHSGPPGPGSLRGDQERLCQGLGHSLSAKVADLQGERRGKARQSLGPSFLLFRQKESCLINLS